MLSKYAYDKVLCFFLENPTREVYVRELSRILKISPYTSDNALNRFYEENILKCTKKGRAHFYRLRNDSYSVKYLKTAHVLFKINSIPFRFSNEIISIAVYGSYASGEFDEKSDFDLLILSSEKKDYPQICKKIEDKMHVHVPPLVLTLFEWEELSKKDEEFYIEVIKNHVLIYGSELVV
jgi:hypothetical protein